MNNTIVNSIEILLEEKPTTLLQAKVSKSLKEMVVKKASERNMEVSGFIRVALVNECKK